MMSPEGVVLLLICTVSAAFISDVINPTFDGRIVGGQTVNIANYPYQLSLRRNGTHYCGAVIIGNNWALSAAHCVIGIGGTFTIRSGSSMINSGGTIHNITRMVVHSNYNSSTYDYDIVALQIAGNFSLGAIGVQRILLPAAGVRPAAGTSAVVSGWGNTTENGTTSSQLQAVTVPIVSQASCRTSYGNASITDRMICAGYVVGGRGFCQRDNGGPLVVGTTLVGIVSWSYGCARPNFPGVYTCTGTLRNWILSATGI